MKDMCYVGPVRNPVLLHRVSLFSLVPLVWESNPKLQGVWCKTHHQTDRGSDPNHWGIWSPPRARLTVGPVRNPVLWRGFNTQLFSAPIIKAINKLFKSTSWFLGLRSILYAVFCRIQEFAEQPSPTGPRKLFKEVTADYVGRHCSGFPGSFLSGTLVSYGASAVRVTRTSFYWPEY